MSGGGARRGVARRATAAALAVVTVAPVGCYRFVPATAEQLSADAVTRLDLSLAGTQALTGQLGPNVQRVFGRVARQTADTVVLALEETTTLQGQTFASSGATVAIPVAHVTRVEVRERSRGRTAGVLAAGIGAAVLVAVVAKGKGDAGTTSTPPPPPPP